MTTATRERDGDLKTAMASYFAAIRESDLDAITAHYAEEVVAYDAILKLEFRGREAYAAHWKACLEMCANMTFEPRDPVFETSGDLGFGHALVRCGGTDAEGNSHTGWVRATWAARRRDGRWHIVHEHYSLPFDPESMKMLGELEP